MGDYSYSEHIEIFGGPPEPGEAYPDLEQVDLMRKEAKENPPPPKKRGPEAAERDWMEGR